MSILIALITSTLSQQGVEASRQSPELREHLISLVVSSPLYPPPPPLLSATHALKLGQRLVLPACGGCRISDSVCFCLPTQSGAAGECDQTGSNPEKTGKQGGEEGGGREKI